MPSDTAPCQAMVELAKDADVLVHEAYSPDLRAHSKVLTLVLWHLLPASDVTDREWLEPASRHFNGEILVSKT